MLFKFDYCSYCEIVSVVSELIGAVVGDLLRFSIVQLVVCEPPKKPWPDADDTPLFLFCFFSIFGLEFVLSAFATISSDSRQELKSSSNLSLATL